jgi:hypothetical protein
MPKPDDPGKSGEHIKSDEERGPVDEQNEIMTKHKKHEGGPPGFGKGLQPSPPDPNDLQLNDLLGAELLSTTTYPSVFTAYNPPPVLNQGTTPQCVAYSSASMKAWQDRRDNGVWYNFDKPLFFNYIGGTSNGANLRNAMVRMHDYGYPVVTYNNQSAHKVKYYYAASLAHLALKAALMAYGPIVLGVHWYNSWINLYSNGQVPPPSGGSGGHAILCIGWYDGLGFRFRNSWGTGWGPKGGDCYIPARYLSTFDGGKLAAFEAWKTIDLDQ